MLRRGRLIALFVLAFVAVAVAVVTMSSAQTPKKKKAKPDVSLKAAAPSQKKQRQTALSKARTTNAQTRSTAEPTDPARRAEAKLEESLFVDADEAAEHREEAEEPAGGTPTYALDKVRPAVFRGDVRKLPQLSAAAMQQRPERREMEEPESLKHLLPEAYINQKAEPNVPLAPMPNPTQNFPGLSRNDACTGGPCGNGTPPDTNGDVGPNHYIQAVNSSFGIYNKTGTLLASFTENSLFSAGPTGTICDNNSGGDPVVIYDSLADRWILTNLAYTGNATVGPFLECMAVSKTSDPVAGGWYLYAVRMDTGLAGQPPANTFPDYPKFGTWNDCLYYSGNGFANGASYSGGLFASFSRTDMYSGAALTASLGFSASTSDFFAMLPSNLSAPAGVLPPNGTPNYYVQESLTAFNYRVRKFTAGPNCGAGGTLGAATTVAQTSYTGAGGDVVPQPPPAVAANNLDTLFDRMMQKNQYRNIGGTESLWVVHTSQNTGGPTTPQWAQINVTGGTIVTTAVQQQVYAPDASLWRWMASIAADKDGNVAMAYSTSNGTSPNFPSIAYSGRLAGDPLNQLPQTEVQLVAGNGSQTGQCGGAPCLRWGDYTAISVDPSDSCTFWITNEYFVNQANGSATSPIWNTRIGSFAFPTCVAAPSSPFILNAPTGLSFTGVTALAITLNWADNALNEDGYVIYQSTDNVNFTFAALTGPNATSQTVSGLNPSTNYFFKVYATAKGALSTALAGNQATNAPGSAISTPSGGLWSQTTTWNSGIVPTSSDNVTISDGATVTIDTAAVAFNVAVGSGGAAANLTWDATTARTLTVGQSVTIASNGTFTGPSTGTVTTHVLSVGTDLTNNGVLDFSTNGDTAGAGITFTGATNNTFGGSGGTTDIRTLTVNKGTSNANTIELNPTNFTVQGTAVDGAPMAFLTLTNGTLKVSGTFALTGRVFTTNNYTIPATAGFWLNNPNFIVAPQGASPTNSGLLRISQGTFNVGTISGNSMGLAAGSTTIVEGGAINATGKFGVSAAATAINYTQTNGTITVCTIGNGTSNVGSFDLGTSLSSVINISGGTIVTQLQSTGATQIDYRNQAGSGIAGVTGGTLQLGNAASGAAKAFVLKGVVPNLVITNTSANHTASWTTGPVNFNNISLNVTINTGNTLNLGNVTYLFDGTVFTNNGTLTHNGASSSFVWFNAAAPVSYTGTGTVTAPMTNFSVQADQGLTIDPASSNIPTLAVRLFSGSIHNANKLTVGNAAATSATIQIGNTTTPTAAGTFDTTPIFNPGTAGIIFSYLRTSTARSTGPEVPAARTITTFSYDDNDVTHSLTIAGGDFTVTGTTTLTNGRVVTGANTFVIGSAGTIVRTNGYIDGNLRKTYGVAGSKTYEVGTASGFSPVTVNATAGTFPADFTVKATQGPQPSVNAATSVQRYWTLTNTTVSSADLTFAYLVTDVQGTEANYKVIRIVGGTPVSFPTSTVNTGAHTATLTGATSFSDWTVGEVTSPTAANSSISGRITDPSGAPVAGATVNLNGAHTLETITDSNGNYSFANVETNGFYTVTPALANYTFAPANRSFSLVANKTDAVFTASLNATASSNAIDTNEYFVRQQYLDFLGREPDQAGFNYWAAKLNQCNGDAACQRQGRIDVSAAFFLSQEFQDTGSYVYRLYNGALGRQVNFNEFSADRQQVVGGANLDAAKTAFANAFVTRAEFMQKYQGNTTGDSFVDALLQSVRGATNADLTGIRANLISRYNSGSTMDQSRALVLRDVAENPTLGAAVNNPSFVAMEYFGYLRRGIDQVGYDFWLNVLNTSGAGNYRGMVCSFITSAEYQHRFGNVVTHSNTDCGP